LDAAAAYSVARAKRFSAVGSLSQPAAGSSAGSVSITTFSIVPVKQRAMRSDRR
jgi:hypothetical protein